MRNFIDFMMRTARPTGLLRFLDTKQPPNGSAQSTRLLDIMMHLMVRIISDSIANRDVAKADDVAIGFKGGEFGKEEGSVSVEYWLCFIVGLLVRSEQL